MLMEFNDLNKNMNNIESFVVPEGVEWIGKGAFEDCISLKTISLPSSLKFIDEDAFAYSSIEELVVPEGIEHIQWATCAMCKSLKKLVLPRSLKRIFGRAFIACEAMEEVTLPANVEIDENSVFTDYSPDVDYLTVKIYKNSGDISKIEEYFEERDIPIEIETIS